MEVNNPKYQHQGIHVIASIFTVDKGVLKVLLVKRKNEPFKDCWALTGGALYNTEDLEDGLNREIYEKTGLSGNPPSGGYSFPGCDRTWCSSTVLCGRLG